MAKLPSKKVLAEMTVGTVAASALATLAVHVWRQRRVYKREQLVVIELLRRVVVARDKDADLEAKQLQEVLGHMRRVGLYTPEMTAMLQELADGTLTDDRGLGLEILLRELGFMLRQRNL
jgi:hypothetical protein